MPGILGISQGEEREEEFRWCWLSGSRPSEAVCYLSIFIDPRQPALYRISIDLPTLSQYLPERQSLQGEKIKVECTAYAWLASP